MTACKVWFFYGNSDVLSILKDIAEDNGLKVTSPTINSSYSFTIDVKTSTGQNLTAGQMSIIKTVCQDMGIYIKWL